MFKFECYLYWVSEFEFKFECSSYSRDNQETLWLKELKHMLALIAYEYMN